jgi:CRISPR type III-associated protein (TIGR04423 family)
MEKRYKKIELENIPSGNYQGYYWKSNMTKPKVQLSGDIDKAVFKQLPFVLEANYYDPGTEKSIQVKNIDGKYLVAEIDVKDCEAKEYIGHDIERNFLLVEAWANTQDETYFDDEGNEMSFLEGMTTKTPVWSAFKGFVKSKKQKND